MKKHLSSMAIASLLGVTSVTGAMAQQPKYVFYFIGDGMGHNHVHLTNLYLKSQGESPLLFTTFPVMGMATTHSASNYITDSAAAGTALATGEKTKNGTISMDASHSKKLESVADWAINAGRSVGILSSVSLDHATPAVFYANQASRSSYYAIGASLPSSKIDFFAGAGFVQEVDKNNPKSTPLSKLFKQGGYEVFYGKEAYDRKNGKAEKVILVQDKEANPRCFVNAIDQDEDDMNLPYITEQAIDFLDAKGKGFFMMVEGGIIDWASHAQDAATAVQEVVDFDEAVQEAYDFYLKHPKETLIVITADHETGGLGLGQSGYVLQAGLLEGQVSSADELSEEIKELRQEASEAGTSLQWSDMKAMLQEELGFGDEVKLTDKQEAQLKAAFEEMTQNGATLVKSEYKTNERMAQAAIQVLDEAVNIDWTSNTHTGTQVPVYAIGAGSEAFRGLHDNTDLPKLVRKVAGY